MSTNISIPIIKELTKFRLTLSVVFSSFISYFLGASEINYIELFYLITGGILIVGSSNIFNPVIERDLDKLMKRTQHRPLPKEEIIQIHSSKIYYIHMYGFLPGFMYLGGLDSKLFLKRKNIPSRRVLKGSVAIGGTQTGIYPSNSPGGWYVIGNTPLNLFNTSNSTKPVIIPDANYIKFIPVSAEEHSFIEYSVNNLKYKLQKKDYND